MQRDKKYIRKRMLEIRNKIPKPLKIQKDEKITTTFENLLSKKGIKSVLLYASYGSEVDTWKIFHFCNKSSIKTAFPRVTDNHLELFWIDNIKQLSHGYKSILEPQGGVKASIEEIEVIVVPGIAFDRRCFRIGYGKGFYDRLLFNRRGLAVGLAYEEQIVDEIPVESFDQKVDLIITDERMISCV
ncbi:MAG: 5-formyltetrahydrofolate cyclo-ligase [Thermodesulfovibrio sp.]|nr:5-formyltetrahydrofolate cyclo-ligase [Thermodesulfovibrio sp.]